MGNRLSDSDGDSSIVMARYEYTIVDHYSSHSPSYNPPLFRQSPLRASFLVICWSLKILCVIAVVIILSLIPVYLSPTGNGIAVENTNDGISITAKTTPILISSLLRIKADQCGIFHQFNHKYIADNN